MEKEKVVSATIAAAIAASGVAADAAFDDPGQILQNDNPQPVVQHIDGVGQDDDVQDQDSEKTKKQSRSESFRQTILELPLVIRLVVVLPLWAVGNVITFAGSWLINLVSPAFGWFLNVLFVVLAVTLAFTLSVKAIFPDMPLRKILNRKTFSGIFILTALAGAADTALAIYWPEYGAFQYVIKGAATLVPLVILVVWFSVREKRRRVKEHEAMADDPAKELVYTSMGQTFTIREP